MQFLTQYYVLCDSFCLGLLIPTHTYLIQGLIETYVEIGGKKIDKGEDMKESCVHHPIMVNIVGGLILGKSPSFKS